MHIALWILQVLLGVYFIFVGANHFILPEGLPEPMSWMYDLPTGLHYFSGTVEILAGLGLILPGLTRIQTRLTPLAGAGLILLMAGAAVWHAPRGEIASIVQNVVFAALAGFVAFGRWRLRPLQDRGAELVE
ncbi:MAG: hypothetical protein CL878_04420 [Dehalococcoidia bacterium]|nr:hypothetical protein [Dehalococcoidia bacterium]